MRTHLNSALSFAVFLACTKAASIPFTAARSFFISLVSIYIGFIELIFSIYDVYDQIGLASTIGRKEL
jgi:hypothetical protein